MRVTITEDEFEAICFAEDLVNTYVESADDDFAHDASIHLNFLLNLIAKLRDARAKDHELVNISARKRNVPRRKPRYLEKTCQKGFGYKKPTHSTQT